MEPKAGVRRRQVWYFHGFDPATTQRYRRLFEAASDRLDVQIQDLPDGGAGWRVLRAGVVTDIRYCRYEDLVRGFQNRPLWRRFFRGVVALAAYMRDGALLRIAGSGPRVAVLMLSPLITVLGVISIVVALSVAAIPGFAGWIIGGIAAAALAMTAFSGLFLHLVADLFAYIRALALGTGFDGRAYDGRIAEIAQEIARQIEVGDAADEVLLVGHSLGGVAAILTLDRLLRRIKPSGSAGLLTLGSVHGVMMMQRGGGRDRLAEAIRRIAADRRVFWLDVTAPRDAFCLPLVDPLLLAGGAPGLRSPRVISAQLSRAPRIPGDRRTVFSAMRRHMGYLLAPQAGSGFDYADLITGPVGMAEAFGDRGNSPKAQMWQGGQDRE